MLQIILHLKGVSYKELRVLTECMIKYLRGDTEDLETNQQAIGMKCLFRGFSTKAWNRADFSDKKCAACDRIVN